jgi:broad specificity phosphatase PhoE
LSAPILADLTATLVLVRHGETTWIASGRFQGQRDPRLTTLGRSQAAAVAARLADPKAPPPLAVPEGRPAAVWHSPLQRAKATALPIAAAAGSPPVPLAGLRELSQGEWEGRTRRSVTRAGGRLDAWIADPVRNAAPGGETVEAARPRIRDALVTILDGLGGSPGESASDSAAGSVSGTPWGIVVAHGGTLKVVLLLLLDLPLSHFWDFAFDPGGISIVELANGRAVLRVHNVTAHLSIRVPETADRGGAL